MSDVQAAAVTDEELVRATPRVVRMREEVSRVVVGQSEEVEQVPLEEIPIHHQQVMVE